jgi:hypothetical protein
MFLSCILLLLDVFATGAPLVAGIPPSHGMFAIGDL